MSSTSADPRDLTLTRFFRASPEKVFAAWTRPELLCQWFAPKPWTTSSATLDVRPGGSSRVVMRSPEGQEFPHHGVYLEVIPNRRLVSTSAFTEAWIPAPEPTPGGCDFPMVLTLSFEPEGEGTRYNVLVKHWRMADREQHEKMGFHEGWGICCDQLAQLVERAGPPAPQSGSSH